MNDATVAAETILERARALAPQIEASAAEIERERRLPAWLVDAMTGAGLFRMLVPRSLGGCELDLATFARVIEEVAKADGSTAWCLSQNAGVSLLAGSLPRQGAVEVFGDGTTRSAGGYGPATALRVEGGYRVSGDWSYASGIRHANWLRAGCRLVDEQGSASPVSTASDGFLLFFPAHEASIDDVWQVSGLRGTASDRYSVRDIFIPEHRAVLNQPLETGTLYAFGTTQAFSIGFASVALGLARAGLDALFDLAATKSPRGIRGLLREQPRVQGELALAEATLRSARLLLHQAIDDSWREVAQSGRLEMRHRIDIRLATTYAIQRAAEVVDVAYHHAGGSALFTANAFERRFRDVHAVTQQVQARPDHYEPVGQYLMGLDPDMQWL
jgi:indole-3-acetate monooxygenase